MAELEMNPQPSGLALRLAFDDGVLSETQIISGLELSWFLLKPHFRTISEVVSNILVDFDLRHSCPHGIILVMDGYVLPEFLPISILKDKDLISVKRKTRLLNASKAVQEATSYIEEVDRQIVGYQSESKKGEDEEVKSSSPVQNASYGDLASKKRKSSSNIESPNELDENKEYSFQESATADKTKKTDDFVELQSISILNDKDRISVKRKETRLLNASKAVQEPTTYIEDGVVEEITLPSGVKLLANEEVDRQIGGPQSESEKGEDDGVKSRSPVQNASYGDLASEKRKSSSKIELAKKKRKVQTKSSTVQKKHAHESERTKPKIKRKHRSRSNQNAHCSPDVMEKFANDLMPESNFKSELDENKEDSIQESPMPDKTKKLMGRLEAFLEVASDPTTSIQLCDRQRPVKDLTIDTDAKKEMVAVDTGSEKEMVAGIIQQYDEDSDAEGDLVPVVTRPGHIRFTSSGKGGL